jgi:prophage tail gpP-like protein
MTGIIEDISQPRDKSNFIISIRGRDKTGELIDSYMKPKQYRQKNFAALIKGVLQNNGYSFNIIQDVDNLKLIDKIEDGGREKIFDFLDNYAKKAQVLLLTNENGSIVITREGSELAKNTLDEESIINSNLLVSSSERYKYIDVYGSLKTDYSNKRSEQQVSIINSSVNSNKRVIIKAEKNSSRKSLESLANWYKNVKQAKGAKYECSVKNHFQDDQLWKANSLVNLVDETRNISGTFLLQGVKYRSGVDGNYTDLSIVNLGSFGLPPLNALLSKLISSGKDLGAKFS